MREHTTTGIPGIPDVDWGTHYCHFYDSHDDLADTLVPYFKAGLDTGDACLWVTSTPLRAADARAALAAVTPDLASREASGQIEIIDHEQWYLRTGKADAAETLQGWIEREESALARGYAGLRLSGNTYWLERADWDSFVEYERLVNEAFQRRRILGLCSYCFARCSAQDVLDVVTNHQFAVVRRANTFQVVESAGLELARRDLLRVQRAADELKEADRRKDQFIAMLGHELRNPLAPIATAIDLIRLRGNTRDRRELDVVERQVKHLTTLVDDLLDLSRITRGQLKLALQPTLVREILSRAVEVVAPMIDAREQHLDVECADTVLVNADADRLVQVFTNVLRNAAKYTQAGGRLGARVSEDDAQIRITFTDNGPGISDDVLPRVFEPFVQGERPLDRRDGGLGLGLPIVRSLVEMHGGTVSIDSSRSGTNVEIRVPKASAAVRTASQGPAPLARSEGHRLLVVDDNLDASMLLADCLEQLGYEVRVAHNATGALAIADRWHPDIAILDIGLPDSNGYELAEALRRSSQRVRLIALTGYGTPGDIAAAQRAGFDHHLTKPVRMSILGRVLRDASQ